MAAFQLGHSVDLNCFSYAYELCIEQCPPSAVIHKTAVMWMLIYFSSPACDGPVCSPSCLVLYLYFSSVHNWIVLASSRQHLSNDDCPGDE